MGYDEKTFHDTLDMLTEDSQKFFAASKKTTAGALMENEEIEAAWITRWLARLIIDVENLKKELK